MTASPNVFSQIDCNFIRASCNSTSQSARSANCSRIFIVDTRDRREKRARDKHRLIGVRGNSRLPLVRMSLWFIHHHFISWRTYAFTLIGTSCALLGGWVAFLCPSEIQSLRTVAVRRRAEPVADLIWSTIWSAPHVGCKGAMRQMVYNVILTAKGYQT